MLGCVICRETGYFDTRCANLLRCPYRDTLEFKDGRKCNCVVNQFKHFREVIVYKDMFLIRPSESESVERGRKFFKDSEGYLVAKDSSVSVSDLYKSFRNSIKRTRDNFLGYAFCNSWRYFITLTFDPSKVKNRTDDEELKRAWKVFREKLQRIDGQVIILCVPERQKSDGALHFHCLVGGIDLTDYMKQACNHKVHSKHYGEPLYSKKYHSPIYNLKRSVFNFGYTTVVEIEQTQESILKSILYMAKYMSKEMGGDIISGYNCKRYYRTKNLNFKEKKICYKTEKEVDNELHNLFVKVHKDTDKFTVYRQYGD